MKFILGNHLSLFALISLQAVLLKKSRQKLKSTIRIVGTLPFQYLRNVI